mgnify:CR=1 FL=1
MERVVITGMGAITPVGNDVPSFWESLKTGKCGIGPITKFDVSDFKVKLGAEVKDFDPTQYMEKREARRADANVHYAMTVKVRAAFRAAAMTQGRQLRPLPYGRYLRLGRRRSARCRAGGPEAARKGSRPRFAVRYPGDDRQHRSGLYLHALRLQG